MDQRHKPGMVLLSGNSHPGLAEEVARHLGVGVGSCLVYHNTNRSVVSCLVVIILDSSIIPFHLSLPTILNVSIYCQGDDG